MWYFEWNRQPYGPINKEAIAEHLRAGRINAQTLVWREGMSEWKPLIDTELAVLIGVTPPPLVQNITTGILPAYTYPPQYPKLKLEKLSKLFWWWFGLIISMVPLFVVLVFYILNPERTWIATLVCIFWMPVIAGAVMQYILVYRFWQVVQDGFARTTPGKAVGFLFIPFFNYYWFFIGFWGLAKDMNGYIERHFGAKPELQIRQAHPVIPLLFILSTLGYVLFCIVDYGILFVNTISGFSGFWKPNSIMLPFVLALLFFIVTQLVFMIWMNFDFYLTSKSTLAAEEK
jgi:hypothetical protein